MTSTETSTELGIRCWVGRLGLAGTMDIAQNKCIRGHRQEWSFFRQCQRDLSGLTACLLRHAGRNHSGGTLATQCFQHFADVQCCKMEVSIETRNHWHRNSGGIETLWECGGSEASEQVTPLSEVPAMPWGLVLTTLTAR